MSRYNDYRRYKRSADNSILPTTNQQYGPSASTANPTNSLLPPARYSASSASLDSRARQAELGAASSEEWEPMMAGPEDDDWMHNPDSNKDLKYDRGTIFTARGFLNVGCLFMLILCLVTLFAGYPIITHLTETPIKTNGAYNIGGINSTGQVPLISNIPNMIDNDTPQEAYTRTGFDGKTYNLVFSDEFEKEGRTFFPGDDPFWTGVDLNYWPTGDLEWYDPAAITTKDGHLVITINQQEIHDLNFRSGMLQSWNQMCFQYSIYIEASVSLPGNNNVGGFWPGVWMMGNLGRPGYGATTDGTWPYSYDSCDYGTLANQTNPQGTGPEGALISGANDGPISYLPGQRMSSCTCKGEDHAGPDVTYGRGVPEIDVLEGQIDLTVNRGQVSQSAQFAPFDAGYEFLNTSKGAIQYDTDITIWNSYKGGTYQEAVSSLTYIDSDNYVGTSGKFGIYGFEMFSDPNNRNSGYITWVADGKKSWTMYPAAVGPLSSMNIGQRLISEEPMAMVINFGMSNNFQAIDLNHLTFPAEMRVDYMRVYQRSEGRMGCDPDDRPTAAYIKKHSNAYNNANLTTWGMAGYTMPKNSLINSC
ncbi:glucosidase [Cryptococcus bacillisporus CA1873]|uniref:Glucosidase n=1 Tax=Cryptococcus bacillisporus CA1873 TaxID=1296111 RepID=A0ABR5B9N7_CRYGA|nr:glucosidase [Cryptococcus bacillisporus CA1873]|eukprot:KIR60302.1 glucosidase [Cryptococcus gattii CA1873]